MSGAGELVFVYGTLRVGASNHHRMRDAEWVRRGVVRGRLYRVSWYPGLVPDEAGVEIVGDVFRVGPRLMRELDAFEGLAAGSTLGEEYERRRLRVRIQPRPEAWDDLPDEIEAWVWAWRKPVDGLLEVATGDWMDVDRPRQPSWFTGLGCLGLVAIPFGGMVLQGTAAHLGLRVDGDLATCLFLLVSGAGGLWAGTLAMRRRERGQAFQVLLLAGGILWGFLGLLFLSDVLN